MNKKIINLETDNRFKGVKGNIPNENDNIEDKQKDEILLAIQEISAASESNKNTGKEVEQMRISSKDYIDNRIGMLEKSIESKMDSQERLISEKIDHLHTKIEGTITDKFNSFQTEQNVERKESKRFYVGTAIALAATVVTIIGVFF